MGLQLTLREYDFDSKNKAVFSGADIMNIFPVVKHINPRVGNLFITMSLSAYYVANAALITF